MHAHVTQRSWTVHEECSSVWVYVIFSHDKHIVVYDNRLWNTVECYKVTKMNKLPPHTRDETYKHGNEWKEKDRENMRIGFLLHKNQVRIHHGRSQHGGYLWGRGEGEEVKGLLRGAHCSVSPPGSQVHSFVPIWSNNQLFVSDLSPCFPLVVWQ